MARALALLLLMLAALPAWAAPKADLWERWTAHDPASTLSIDHRDWDDFLKRYRSMGADGIARFDYARARSERAVLDFYLAELTMVPIARFNRAEQLAFWINLYNALTIRTVLSRYPVDSIRDIDISPGLLASLFAGGPWGAKLIRIDGAELSLDDIEHRILRPIWRDARIHYAVNCAALGCPNLPPEAFTAENAETLLEAGARAYVNHPRGATVTEGRLVVSSIYDWYQEDFGGDDAGVIAHLRRYADGPLADALARITTIADDRYDWALNDVKR